MYVGLVTSEDDGAGPKRVFRLGLGSCWFRNSQLVTPHTASQEVQLVRLNLGDRTRGTLGDMDSPNKVPD